MSHDLSSITRAVRAGIATDKEHGAVVPPIHLTSTFAFEGFGKPRTFDYTRSGNPTRAQLASAIAELERGAGAVVTSTGMSAVTLVLSLVKPGDTVVAAHDCYGGTQRLLRALAAKGHFDLRFVDLTANSRPETGDWGPETGVFAGARLVWIETPSNPLLRITDIRSACAAAHNAGALAVVDNTFLSPALQQPLTLGADIVVHSTTKYLNGHSDVVGGAVVARDAAIHEELGWWANCLGITGAPFDSFLTLRGIRTLFPRIRQHELNSAAVVDALTRHAAVTRVNYPGLAAHPGHEIAKAQQSGFGAMVSFEIVGGVKGVELLTERLRCFTLAESLGGVESLVAHPATMTHASMTADARAAAGISESLVRLSVGTEDAVDLVHDLTSALDHVLGSRLSASSAGSQAESRKPRAESHSRATRDLVLLGVGSIGRELLSQLAAHGSAFRVCGLIDRSGWVSEAGGFSAERLRDLHGLKERGGKLADAPGGTRGTAAQAVEDIAAAELWHPILVDATAADTTSVLDTALSRGWDLVLANKVPLAADLGVSERLQRKARLHGRRILFEATVGAGLPVIDTLRKLQEAGDTILSIEGCPSGTLGYLFGELGRGRTFSDAVASAVAAGYAEPDPRVDLSGLDVARKALILARLIGFKGDLHNVAVESLVPRELESVTREEFLGRVASGDVAWRERVERAREKGVVLRYRARATPTSVSVGLVEVATSDSLGSLQGTDNQFSFVSERYRQQPLVIRGPGAGPAVTAAGVFNDLTRLVAEQGRPNRGLDRIAPMLDNQHSAGFPAVSPKAPPERTWPKRTLA
jgi:cystathionine gamma-synthase